MSLSAESSAAPITPHGRRRRAGMIAAATLGTVVAGQQAAHDMRGTPDLADRGATHWRQDNTITPEAIIASAPEIYRFLDQDIPETGFSAGDLIVTIRDEAALRRFRQDIDRLYRAPVLRGKRIGIFWVWDGEDLTPEDLMRLREQCGAIVEKRGIGWVIRTGIAVPHRGRLPSYALATFLGILAAWLARKPKVRQVSAPPIPSSPPPRGPGFGQRLGATLAHVRARFATMLEAGRGRIGSLVRHPEASTPIPPSLPLREVPAKDAEALRDKIEIHGSNVILPKGDGEERAKVDLGALTVDFLYAHDLAPRYGVLVDDPAATEGKPSSQRPILLSLPYYYERRLAVTAYVGTADGQRYEARTYYLSGSHAVWRHLPGYSTYDGAFDKLTDEAQLAIPGAVQQALGRLSQPDMPHAQLRDNTAERAFYSTSQSWDALDEGGVEEKDRTARRDTSRGRRTVLCTGDAIPDRSPAEVNAALNARRDQGPYPNLSQVMASWRQYSPTYKQSILVETVPDRSDPTITYRFHSMLRSFNGQERLVVWLGGAEDATGRIGMTGLRSGYVQLGNLAASPYEYYHPHDQTHGYGEGGNTIGHYQAIYPNYHDHITLFQEYRRALLQRHPEMDPERSGRHHMLNAMRRGLDPVRERLAQVDIHSLIRNRRFVLAAALAGAVAIGGGIYAYKSRNDRERSRREAVLQADSEERTLDATRTTFWSIAEETRRTILATNDPRFSEIKARFQQQSVSESNWEIVQAILDFNRIRNGKEWLSTLDDDYGNVPQGTTVSLPRDRTILFLGITELVREAKADAEAVPTYSDVAASTTLPEAREVLSGQRLYLDPRYDAAGKAPLQRIAKPSSVVLTDERDPNETSRPKVKKSFFILHSTITPTDPKNPAGMSNNVVAGIKQKNTAHYVVTRSGGIRYVLDDGIATNHAGNFDSVRRKAIWRGVKNISDVSIGIEVEASAGEDWNSAQIASVRWLLHERGAAYGIPAGNVLTHAQVSCYKIGGSIVRQRKSDPKWDSSKHGGKELVEILVGVPNDLLIDPDVVAGTVVPNPSVRTSADHAAEVAKMARSRGYVYAIGRSEALRKAANIPVVRYDEGEAEKEAIDQKKTPAPQTKGKPMPKARQKAALRKKSATPRAKTQPPRKTPPPRQKKR